MYKVEAQSSGDDCDVPISLQEALAQMNDMTFHSGYNSGHFVIYGSTKGAIFQEDTYHNVYDLGTFAVVTGTNSYYTDGTFCPSAEISRKSTIIWQCGQIFEVTSATERAICDYYFEATLPCCDLDNPQAWDSRAGIKIDLKNLFNKK